MYFNENEALSVICIHGFPMGRFPEAVVMGNVCNCTVWVDSRSINEYNEADVFIATGDEENLMDFICWIQNTLGVFEAA